MNDRLHEIIGECAYLHENFLSNGLINDFDAIQEKLEDVQVDVKSHYLTLLMQYYFQNNNLKLLKELLLLGYRFELRFSDIKEAFLKLKDDEDNVIEFLDENVVMLKDTIEEKDLKAIYDYYQANSEYKNFLDEPLELIKRNRYVCAKAYKIKDDFGEFFIIEDLLESLKQDMPFLLK